MRRYLALLGAAGLILAVTGTAGANTVESSTMWFYDEGGTHLEWKNLGGGVEAWVGTVDMIAGYYYVSGGPGESIGTNGGFDLYAKEGGTAYVQGMSPDTWTIGSDHDAYSEAGPWGSWYDPDCTDWDKYELELTTTHWYLRYKSPSEELEHGKNPSPMSGIMDWANMVAYETDAGTQYGYLDGNQPDQSTDHGGGAGAWDWSCQSHVEVIPLQYSAFKVDITFNATYPKISMTPIPEPMTMLGVFLGVGGLAGYMRKRRIR